MPNTHAQPKTSPFKECYFTNPDGLKQYYRDYDSASNYQGEKAPVLLCMPGLTRNSKDFAGIASHLQDRFRIICIEQRGRGNSEWDPDPSRYHPATYVQDMFALLEHLGIKKLHLLGTSLGGLMSIMMQSLKPGDIQFDTIVINDIGAEIDPAGIERISSYVGKIGKLTSWKQALDACKWMNTGVFPNFTEAEWENFARALFIEKNGEFVANYDPALSQNFDNNTETAAPELWPVFDAMKNVPTLVIRGELSDILSPHVLEKMTSRLPNVKGVTIPGVGHAPLMTEPASIQAFDDFYAENLS